MSNTEFDRYLNIVSHEDMSQLAKPDSLFAPDEVVPVSFTTNSPERGVPPITYRVEDPGLTVNHPREDSKK